MTKMAKKDWKYWNQREAVTLHEAICLSLGHNPTTVPKNGKYPDQYWERMKLLEEAVRTGEVESVASSAHGPAP
jgi:hypothetical protein